MADRDNHYEAAFEAYLRSRGVPYVAVDEARRSVLAGGGTIKSLDFIVSAVGVGTWLVDVKGRRFPSGDTRIQYWKNWSTRDDLEGLAQWESLFGEPFVGLLVFAYHVVGDRAPLPAERLFAFRGQLYALLGIRRGDYAELARPLSSQWDTVSIPVSAFRRLARPMDELLRGTVGGGEGKSETQSRKSETRSTKSETNPNEAERKPMTETG